MSLRRAKVSPDRRVHILDGDRTGGGHRAGTGLPGKTEFPVSWSDDKVISEIEDVANDPASIRVPGRNGRVLVSGMRDGVEIEAIVERGGAIIITGYPMNLHLSPKPSRS